MNEEKELIRIIPGYLGFGYKIVSSNRGIINYRNTLKEAKSCLEQIKLGIYPPKKDAFDGFQPMLLTVFERISDDTKYFCSNPREAENIIKKIFKEKEESNEFSWLVNLKEPESPDYKIEDVPNSFIKEAEKEFKKYERDLREYKTNKSIGILYDKARADENYIVPFMVRFNNDVQYIYQIEELIYIP